MLTEETQPFSALFEEFAKQRCLKEGSDLLAQVSDINDNYVVVDAGLKSEARIPLAEFYNDDRELEVKVGDEVEVEIELLDNGRGEAMLSRRNTRRKRAWRRMEEALQNEEAVEGVVTARVKGGYSVMIEGVRAFLPGSLVDVTPQTDLHAIVGQKVECRPIKVNAAKNSLVVSRRIVIEKTILEVSDGSFMETLAEGARFEGEVRHIVEYGAFVEIASGICGLVHITDLSWRHTTSVADVLKVGEKVEVIVLSVDREKRRISLGVKQLQPNPWDFFHRAHPPGSRLFGKVTRVLDYGVFVELGDGVQGLVHNSEMSWTRKNPNPGKLYSDGDEVEVAVLEIDIERRRISLGVKQCQPNPWKEFAVAYRKGDKLSGRVRSISEFGMFVEMPGGIDGLVRLPDLSYEKSGEEAIRQYRRGQDIDVVILAVDADRERIHLGIKQLDDSDFESFSEQAVRGSVVSGTIESIAEKGAHVKLDGGVRAFLPISEIAEQRVDAVADFVKEGETREFVLIDSDKRKMRATVSIKERDRRAREKLMQDHRKQPAPKNTLGAILQQAQILAAKKEEEEEAKAGKTAAADSDSDSDSATESESAAEVKADAAESESDSKTESAKEAAAGESADASSQESDAKDSESDSADSESESESEGGKDGR